MNSEFKMLYLAFRPVMFWIQSLMGQHSKEMLRYIIAKWQEGYLFIFFFVFDCTDIHKAQNIISIVLTKHEIVLNLNRFIYCKCVKC